MIWVFPPAAFFVAYFLTEQCFRAKKIPYPFEWSGITAGLGAAFLTLGILSLIRKNGKG